MAPTTFRTSFLRVTRIQVSSITIAAILSGVVNMAMVGAEMVLPLYIQNIRGESAFHSGLMLLPGALVMGLMMPITGAIFDKHGAKRLAIGGMLILTAATLPFAFLTKDTPVTMIVILYAIRMFGISMVMMPVTTSGMNALPMNLISHGTAVNNTFRQVASSIGTAILISVLTNVTKDNLPKASLLKELPLTYKDQAINATLSGYHAAFYVAVIFSIIGFFITFFLKANKKVEGGVAK